MSALVSTWIDDEKVNAELLAPPNAIAVCRVRCGDHEVVRHVSKIVPLNDEARSMLRGGDSFVRRDLPDVMGKIGADADKPAVALSGWTLEQMDLLRLYLVAQYQEMQRLVPMRRGRRREQLVAHLARCGAVLRYVKTALRDHRRKVDSEDAGLTVAQANDAETLLTMARDLLWEQHRNGHLDDKHRSLLWTISAYLVHGAKVATP